MPFDPLKQEVRIGECAWPVSVDCSRGKASLEMAGRRYAVRSLTWAQKRNLARFGKLGPEFFKQQLITATAGTPLPERAEEREALLSVAAWLNAAPAELPFDHVLLARMTVELARWAGCSVATLDECTAADVEALWAARKESGGPVLKGTPPKTFSREPDLNPASSGPDFPEGFRRIVIVPDEPRENEELPRTPLRESAAALPAVNPAAPVVPEILSDLQQPEPEPNQIPPETAKTAVAEAVAVNMAAVEAMPASRVEGATDPAPARNEAIPAQLRQGRSQPTSAAGRRRTSTTFRLVYPAPPPTPAPSAKKDGWDTPPSMPPSVLAEWPAVRAEVSRVVPQIIEQAAKPADSPISAPVRPVEVDRDDLLDEFADRLEEAAASAGVDIFR